MSYMGCLIVMPLRREPGRMHLPADGAAAPHAAALQPFPCQPQRGKRALAGRDGALCTRRPVKLLRAPLRPMSLRECKGKVVPRDSDVMVKPSFPGTRGTRLTQPAQTNKTSQPRSYKAGRGGDDKHNAGLPTSRADHHALRLELTAAVRRSF